MSLPTIEQVLAAFERDRLTPRPVAWVLQLALTAVTVAMAMLPLIYLSLIASVIYGAVWWAMHARWLYAEHPLGAVPYAVPILLGGLLALVMIKPLFSRSPRPKPSFDLDPARQPEAIAFVHRVADAVGAPRPRVIELTCEANAAAAFRPGVLSMFGRELKLVIGLPLVAGMNLRSFGGVLAHEFGHFSQGAGMRMACVVRAVNAWFAQAVDRRDGVDRWLENTTFLSALAWLTRRILEGLLHLGQGISSFALRQMEFHADTYEIRFAGSETFASTSSRLERLDMGGQRARAFLTEIQGQGRVSSNFPDLTRRQADQLPERLRDALEKNRAAAKTLWNHTHPCDADRIRAARQWNDPGIFRLEAPAAALFRDFDALCERVTRHFYEHQAEIPLAHAEWVDNAQLSREDQDMEQELDAINEFFRDRFSMRRPVFVTAAELDARLGFAPAPARWEDLDRQARKLHEAFAREESLVQYRGQVRLARELVRSGFSLHRGFIRIQAADLAGLDEELADVEARLESCRRQLAAFDLAARDIILDALARRWRRGEDAELGRWLELMEMFGEQYGKLTDLEERLRIQQALMDTKGGGEMHQTRLRFHAAALEALAELIAQEVGNMPYPFPHAKGAVTLRTLLTGEDIPPDAILRAQTSGTLITTQLLRLYQRVLGRLVLLARDEIHAADRSRYVYSGIS